MSGTSFNIQNTMSSNIQQNRIASDTKRIKKVIKSLEGILI